jgi:transcriptional regulator with XRE-family HTH domain
MQNLKEIFMNQNNLPETLKELRKQHNLKQDDVADKINVSRQAVSKWERGEATPDIFNLQALSNIYNISLDKIMSNNLLYEQIKPVDKIIEQPKLNKEIIDDNKKNARSPLLVLINAASLIFLFYLLFSLNHYYENNFSNNNAAMTVIFFGFLSLVPSVIILISSFTNIALKEKLGKYIYKIIGFLSIIFLVLTLFHYINEADGSYLFIFPLLFLMFLSYLTLHTFSFKELIYKHKNLLNILALLFLALDSILLILFLNGTGITLLITLLIQLLSTLVPMLILSTNTIYNKNNNLSLSILSLFLLAIKLAFIYTLSIGFVYNPTTYGILWSIFILIPTSSIIITMTKK